MRELEVCSTKAMSHNHCIVAYIFYLHIGDIKFSTSCQAVKKGPVTHGLGQLNLEREYMCLDYAGAFQKKMFVAVVDAHSKWPEAIQMTSTSAAHKQ